MSNPPPFSNPVSNGNSQHTTSCSASAAAAAHFPSSGGAGSGSGKQRFLNRIQGVFSGGDAFTSGVSTSTATGGANLIDRKFMDKLYKCVEKIVKYCQQPRMNLRNSPPYILDTVPDIYERLREIVRKYDENYDTLGELDYFRIISFTLLDKCKRTLKLFKEGKERMYDDNSQYRHKLTKFSLIFSHILKDIEALFPNHVYAADSFRITKQDAARWWASHFDGRSIVPWRDFKQKLFQSYAVEDPNQTRALQNTIDLTGNEHVSIFEFDVFVRLFQPWNNIIETWKALAVVHPGYMAFMTYDEVKDVLNKYIDKPGPGSYVYRLSCTKLGQWAIGYVTQDRLILQTIIQNKSLAQALLDGEREGFYKYPNGQMGGHVPDLDSLVNNLPQVHIKVSQEQYQVYCVMGSTFQLCKICAERDKDVRIEPCGHLICKPCLHSWQSSGEGHSCPFCRREIKGTEEIVVLPYMPISADRANSPDMLTSTTAAADLIDLNYGSRAKQEKESRITGGRTSSSTAGGPPPPRPPRLAGGGTTSASPVNSPGSTRRDETPYTDPIGAAAPAPAPPSAHGGVRLKTIDGNLNYAQLAFTDSDSDFEDLPPAPPPPPPVVVGGGGVGSQQPASGSSQSDESSGGGHSDMSPEYHVRTLVQEGCDERAARRLLAIVSNNLRMAREVLVWFVPKANI